MSDYKLVLPIMCSECMAITTFDIEARAARGATYDCKCGLIMLIKDDLSTMPINEYIKQGMIKRGVAVAENESIEASYIDL